MSNVASIFRTALGVATLLLTAPPVLAGELECSDEPVTARGLGFSPSPEQSAQKAKQEWLKKAVTIYSDAAWDMAKDHQMICVNQGLYSNCKVSAVPCGSTPAPPKKN